MHFQVLAFLLTCHLCFVPCTEAQTTNRSFIPAIPAGRKVDTITMKPHHSILFFILFSGISFKKI